MVFIVELSVCIQLHYNYDLVSYSGNKILFVLEALPSSTITMHKNHCPPFHLLFTNHSLAIQVITQHNF